MFRGLDGARRRQFLLGPARTASIGDWRATSVLGDNLLESGPDLGIAQAGSGDRQVTVLGFILDWTDATRDNSSIAEELASVPSLDGVLEATAQFSGRWAVVARHGGAGIVFTDPAGLRQVHYAFDSSGRVWCGSQAQLLASHLDLGVDDDANDFARSIYFRSYREPFWPAATTRFLGAWRLLPNHYLDLETGQAVRFWPTQPLARDPQEDPVTTVAAMLQGSLQAASHRQPLALALSAGWDSRTLLAASRGIEDVICFTIEDGTAATNVVDVQVARRIAGRLGLRHLVVDGRSVEPHLLEVMQQSVDSPHQYCAAHVSGLLREVPSNRLAVSGNLSELGRSYFQTHYPDLDLTAEGFAGILNMHRSPWAVAAISRWLDETMPVVERLRYDPVDLFHWEIYCGTWLAHGQSEWDTAMETVSPFNCRLILETILAIDPAERILPGNAFHRALMSRLWPEVLGEPINPERIRTRAIATTKRVGVGLLRWMGMYERVKDVWLEARGRRYGRN